MSRHEMAKASSSDCISDKSTLSLIFDEARINESSSWSNDDTTSMGIFSASFRSALTFENIIPNKKKSPVKTNEISASSISPFQGMNSRRHIFAAMITDTIKKVWARMEYVSSIGSSSCSGNSSTPKRLRDGSKSGIWGLTTSAIPMTRDDGLLVDSVGWGVESNAAKVGFVVEGGDCVTLSLV
eukprot:GDKJ01026196.1.p2 GENE.GDKJ01026196.1~~GDKJ01026196.1.p2  ORF type:complete len:184 (+),score=14.26 GDKJ01026196.1:837-1388(+)